MVGLEPWHPEGISFEGPQASGCVQAPPDESPRTWLRRPGSWSTALCDRSLYDDVNEFFWSRANVDALLTGNTTSHGRAYAALRSAFANRPLLRSSLRKTFYERPTWLSVWHTFHRVLLLNALAIHGMIVIAFARKACELEAEELVPGVGLKDERDDAISICLARAHGETGWRLLSTATLTHAALQLLFLGLSRWMTPRHSPSAPSALWLLLALASIVVPPTLYFRERVRTEYVTGLSDGFLLCSFGYALLWTPALLQLPLKLPGYGRAWGGVAPQWTMRPPLAAGLWYCAFWAVVLTLKWGFEYFLVIKALYMPSRALWEGDYRCWEHGHTGALDCSWDNGSSEAMRTARDWFMRLMLLSLRWSMPLMLMVSDTVIFYMVVLSFASTFMARRQGIGERHSWAHIVLTFTETQRLFTEKLVAYDAPTLDKISELRASQQEKATTGLAWSHEGTSREWQDYAVTWNAIIYSLRGRDLLSNAERDDLLFCALNLPEHAAFFGVPVYTALPSMLSAPVFTGSRDRSLIS
eukprot:5855687-Prymnesium_polylepis.1